MIASISKKRFTQEEGRELALEAARSLLLHAGPHAVTLKAVADRIGRTHANLLHHFGTAAELQKALAASISARVGARISQAVIRVRDEAANPAEIVDLIYDAFQKEGVGPLAAWMILTGNRDVLDPILRTLRDVVGDLMQAGTNIPLQRHTLSLVLGALGYSLLGEEFALALGQPPETAREMAIEHLRIGIATAHAEHLESEAIRVTPDIPATDHVPVLQI
ncbi:TetR/AcrR family transcriptional regulator [Aquisediminimonas sediminicola]|uniref:TetR/AcrR family transcriptional regulator n=1 Tax=Alteraquisediminimonas sediminicola TaxID=2676787 RepID=UPI001C8D475B|nr:helix-turn-helix domain-containing protein [Aquisediminimonas sediminicola]